LMLRSGEYKELRECVVGESIMPMRIYQQKSGSSDRREPFVNSIRECKVNVPVFNLTVEPSHNYALSAGVFVKNSQSQRPKDGPNKETVLRSMSISEAYEKVRIADFVGTLNQTPFEKDAGILRFLADIYRNNTSDVMIRLFCDFERMVFSSKKLTDILPHEIYHAAPWKIKR